MLGEILHSRLYFWYHWQISSTHSSTPKSPQRRTLQITPRQLVKSTSSRAFHDLWCWTSAPTPTTYIPTDTSLYQGVQHERRSVVYVLGAAQLPNYRNSFSGCNNSKAYFFVVYSQFFRDWGQCKLSSKIVCKDSNISVQWREDRIEPAALPI